MLSGDDNDDNNDNDVCQFNQSGSQTLAIGISSCFDTKQKIRDVSCTFVHARARPNGKK